jgi:hypothetical protein
MKSRGPGFAPHPGQPLFLKKEKEEICPFYGPSVINLLF